MPEQMPQAWLRHERVTWWQRNRLILLFVRDVSATLLGPLGATLLGGWLVLHSAVLGWIGVAMVAYAVVVTTMKVRGK